MNIGEINGRIPDWKSIDQVQIEDIEGLTNTNYKVVTHQGVYVLRISGENTSLLGINREFEVEALQTAADHKLGPEVIHFLHPEGHLVTRFIEGRHWTFEEYCKPENLRRFVNAVKSVHGLPPIRAVFSPFQRIRKIIEHIDHLGVIYPDGFDLALGHMQEIEVELAQGDFPAQGLCHNDLFSLNFIDDGAIKFIDWEFAGMGDIFYDIATLAYTFDSVGEISTELQDFILQCYFGESNDYLRTRMKQMKFMVLLYSVAWGLLQHGLENAGIINMPEGFDPRSYADFMFNVIKGSDFL